MALESPVDPQEEIDSGSDDEGASLSQSVEEAATQAAAQAQVGVLSPCPLLKTWGQGWILLLQQRITGGLNCFQN